MRVIGDEGEQLGVMDVRDAIRAAREKGLDLVEVAPTAEPPVCRIIDFGKFQYEAKKKANEAKKKQVTIVVKEVKFRPGTDDHDWKQGRAWKVIRCLLFSDPSVTRAQSRPNVRQRLRPVARRRHRALRRLRVLLSHPAFRRVKRGLEAEAICSL